MNAQMSGWWSPTPYFAGQSGWTIQFRDKNALAADEKSDKWRQVR